MVLCAVERVEAAEATDAFSERLAKAQASHGKRSAAARRVADDKREAAREWARTVDIRTDWPWNKREAIRDGVEHWELKREARGEFVSGQDADDTTKRRWARNYLRHCCTNYDSEIHRLFGMVGRDEAYNIIRERIESMIDERFPGLRGDPQT